MYRHQGALPAGSSSDVTYLLLPRKDSRTLMGLMTALIFNFTEENITDVWGKSSDPLCETISYKHYEFVHIHCSKCRGKQGKIIT